MSARERFRPGHRRQTSTKLHQSGSPCLRHGIQVRASCDCHLSICADLRDRRPLQRETKPFEQIDDVGFTKSQFHPSKIADGPDRVSVKAQSPREWEPIVVKRFCGERIFPPILSDP